MKEKSLLLFETKELTAQKYFDFLKDTPWEIYHKQNLETFLETLQNDTFDLIIVEESMVPEEVVALLAESDTPVILSTNSSKTGRLTTILRDFSSADLINAIGKSSFLKIVRQKDGVSYEEPEHDDEDEPVLLEPVFEENSLDAVVLTPEKGDGKTKSSWEVPEKKGTESEPVLEKKPEEKKDIFARIDEIDSILSSLSRDIETQKPEPKTSAKPGFQFGDADNDAQQEKTLFAVQPDVKEEVSRTAENKNENADKNEDKNADFLFDDDYKYDAKAVEPDKKPAVQRPEFDNNMVNDFEAILSDKPLNVPNVKAEEFEIETHDEKIREPEPSEAESSSNVEKKAAQTEDKTLLNEDITKEEIRNWLEKNGRQIIKEIVLEQLSKLSGKDG
ncbi:MAG TPA: hypothetical protein PLD55_05230 [bacterium]|nr:hypothetical protein [bacterium]HPY14016.1 hypothetical protein [bacterium]HQB08505.1 hypothetical protein [bacterium]HQM84070.1 hypothetical protein [bacterium]